MKRRIHLSPTTASSGDPTAPDAIVRVVLEKSPLLVYIANLDFKIVLANRTLREVTGYDTSDAPTVDALVERFYPHGTDYKQRVRDLHEGWKRNEHVMGAKLLVQCKDGNQRTIAWYTSRLRVGRGPSVGYIAMGLDLTTQGTLEQWVSLLQRTLQHIDEGVILTDPSGGVLAWNEGATRLLGYQETQMQGQPIERLFTAVQRSSLLRDIDAAISGPEGRFSDEISFVCEDGTKRELSMIQRRLDGEGGAPLARLTVIAPPESASDGLSAQSAALETKLLEIQAENDELKVSQSKLSARVSTMDAELATQEAAAGQIADLRGQLEEALTDADTARKRLSELEAAANEIDKRAQDDGDEPTSPVAEPPAAPVDGSEQNPLAAELAAVKAELDAARKELDAKTAELDGLTKELEGVKAALDGAKAELEAKNAELGEAQASLDASSTAASESKAALEEAEAAAATAAESLANAQQDLADQQENWVLERARLEDDHRKQMDALTQKSTDQRRELEAQLHTDILAAEERAEMERQKLVDKFAKEKADLAQAAEIAQAEIESRSARSIEEIRQRLESVHEVQPHLAPVSAAVVSADATGTVVGWSAGAAAIDGRDAGQAIGKVIFDDVLALQGIKWKSIFGQVVVAGAIDRSVTLVRADGAFKEVRLHARIVKSASGSPQGVTVELEEHHVAPHAGARADAAIQRLLAPFRAQLTAQVGQAYQGMQSTLARLQQIERLGQGGTPLPLDGLVAQVASVAGGGTVCELGSQHETGDTGRGLAALLFALVDGQADAVISTVGEAPVTVRNANWDTTSRGDLRWLAQESGLGLSFVDGEARIELTAPDAAGLTADEGVLHLDEPESTLSMAGTEEEDLDLDLDEDDLDLVRSGKIALVADEDGDLEVFAGEDSLIKSHDAIYMKVNHLAEIDPVLRTSEQVLARKGEGAPTNSEDLLPIDELDEVADGNDGVSQALLNTAGQMDAYVRGNTVADDELEDSAAGSAGPSEEVLAEMAATDSGVEPSETEPEKTSKGGRKRKKRGRGRKRK